MNRISILAALSLTTLASTTAAFAADLPQRSVAPVFASAPAFSWTGFYVGVNAGYNATQFDRTASANPGFIGGAPSVNLINTIGTRSIKANGFTGGLQGGYNYQINSLVFGLEGDFNFVGAKKSLNPESSLAGSYILASSSNVEWLATIRGRLGFALDRLLVYGTAGIAFGSVKVFDEVDFRPNGAPGLGQAATSSNTRTGYALGGGLEYAFTKNWTMKAEYLYVDLGKTSYTHGAVAGFPNTTIGVSNQTKLNIARVGVNYKF